MILLLLTTQGCTNYTKALTNSRLWFHTSYGTFKYAHLFTKASQTSSGRRTRNKGNILSIDQSVKIKRHAIATVDNTTVADSVDKYAIPLFKNTDQFELPECSDASLLSVICSIRSSSAVHLERQALLSTKLPPQAYQFVYHLSVA